MKWKHTGLLWFASFALTSCSLLGIHLKVKNPRNPGKYPAFDRGTILLGELTPVRQSFDVTFYDLDIRINAVQKSLEGWVAVTARAEANIDSIQLDLDERLAVKALTWEERDGQALTYRRDHRALFIRLPQPLAKGSLFTVHVQYGGVPLVAKKAPWQGGLVWKKDKEKNDWIGVACESEGASIWFPCKDHTSDEPDSAHMRFTIPESNLTVVSNGSFKGAEHHDGLQSFNWAVTNPINLYDITFYVGNYERIEDTYTGIEGKHLAISHYVLKPNAEKARIHFQSAKNHIKVYEELYGPYAWYADGFRLVESPYAGMEHQTAIAYGNGYKKDLKRVEDYIMLHEIGHEWFGNAITASDLADVWLQEGITTYGEVLYLEKQYGRNVAMSHLAFYKLMIANKRPLVGPHDRRFFDYKDGDVYVKGAWMMHTLRNVMNNDSLFFTVLRTFYKEEQKKVTDSKTFVATVNRVTGADYNWFFDQYLYSNKVPVLEYGVREGSIWHRWVDVDTAFDNKLEVEFVLSNGKRIKVKPASYVQLKRLAQEDRDEEAEPDNSKALFGKRKTNKLFKEPHVVCALPAF